MFNYTHEVKAFNPKIEALKDNFSWGVFPNKEIAQIMAEALNKKLGMPTCTFVVKEIL
jgi:hypothetical protein|tara:strand:+ start:1786 stop:1959 length:174 start_codon:yes stop_codon:yes gene_type:complete